MQNRRLTQMYADKLSTYPLVISTTLHLRVSAFICGWPFFFGSLRVRSRLSYLAFGCVSAALSRAPKSHREWTRIDAKAHRTKQNRRLTQMYADKLSTYPLVILPRYICVYLRSSAVGLFSSRPFVCIRGCPIFRLVASPPRWVICGFLNCSS